MEIDQLKQQWQQDVAGDTPPDVDLQQIRNHSGASSLSDLKRSFRKQIVLLALVFSMVIYQFRHKDLLNSVFFWLYLLFSISLLIFFYANFRIVKRLESNDQPLTAHLLQQVTLLQQRMRLHLMFTRGAALLLFILAELVPFFSEESMLVKWHAVHPLIRVAVYIAFIIFQYFVGKKLAEKRYGRHLQRLQSLINDSK
jgi:magnesium-transporting ATPase (P-type)